MFNYFILFSKYMANILEEYEKKLPDVPLFLKTVEDTKSIKVITIFEREKGKFLCNGSHLS